MSGTHVRHGETALPSAIYPAGNRETAFRFVWLSHLTGRDTREILLQVARF